MDTRSEIRDFLTSRRARITPEDVGLTTYGPRRVPGLRREEVATLAGVSVDYYNRMERGNLSGASDSVLDALARALRLDEAERAHLYDLARASQPSAPRRRRSPSRPSARACSGCSIRSPDPRRSPRTATRRPGHQPARAGLLLRSLPAGDATVNFARFIFFDPRARDFFADWQRAARDSVAILRSAAGRDPFDRPLRPRGRAVDPKRGVPQLLGGARCQAHNKGDKHFNHPVVGELELSYNRLELPGDPGLTIVAYSAEPARSPPTPSASSRAGQRRRPRPPSKNCRSARA